MPAMDTKKKYLSANDFLHDSWRLAALVTGPRCKPAILIALRGWNIQHIPLKCASYTGIGENAGEVTFTLGDEIFGFLRKGDKVLVIDDVFDTGKTAKAVKARIDATGAEMRMACVYWKPEKNKTTLKPDYYVKNVGNDWIVFPHEIEGLTPAEREEKDPVLAGLMKI